MGHKGVLIIVQNLPVPLDRRVWLECQALRDAGCDVSVICPMGPGDPAHEVLDGVHLFKYPAPPAARGTVGYLVEFAYCWLRTAWLSVRVYRRRPFRVIQACNPPDTYWLLARFWKLLGVRFVFDQHDLNPELFCSRFGTPTSVLARAQFGALKWLERRTYATADQVISTNDSYRRIAVERGAVAPADVTVVRSGPDTNRLRPATPRPELRRGARFMLAYLGIMGPQDNVDVLLDVMDRLVHHRGRRDVHLVLMGFGDCLDELRARAGTLGLDEWVTFTDRAGESTIVRYMSAAHVGLAPDLKTPLNDVSTHNKIMEFMAFGLPIVSFDILESRVTAQECAVFVPSGDVEAYATAVERLLDDPGRRAAMGRAARSRCVEALDWRHQVPAYVSVFDRLLGRPVPQVPVPQASAPAHAVHGAAAAPVGSGPVVIELPGRIAVQPVPSEALQ